MAGFGGRRQVAIYSESSLSVTQTFGAVGVAEPLVLDNSITHQVIVNNLGDHTAEVEGVYNFSTFPSFIKVAGGSGVINISYQIDKGSGYADVQGTNTAKTFQANATSEDDAKYIQFNNISLEVGWRVRMIGEVDDLSITIAPVSTGTVTGHANFISLQRIGGF